MSALLILALACVPSIKPDDETGETNVEQISAGEAVIDATSQTYWRYLDLESATIVEPATPEDDASWDLGFRRYHVMINGGVSGTGGMELVPFPGVEYDTALDEPTEGWITDEADGDDENDIVDYAFYSWFAYESSTHEVTPEDLIYVVRTVEGTLVKLEFLGYYDDAGTPGYVHIHWGDLDDTWDDETEEDTGDPGDEVACSTDTARVTVTDLGEGVKQAVLATASTEEWVCFSFEVGSVTEGWDLAGMKWTFLNGGEVAELAGADFDALTQAPADGYLTDDGTGAPMAAWYDYDSTEHTIIPQDKMYVVHTAGDSWYKLQFTSYYPEGDDEHLQPHHPTFKFAPVAAP